jgi:hypothetical protein
MSTPPNAIPFFQDAANQTSAYAQGYAAMVQHLAEQDAANTNQYLESLGSPQQIDAANIGDTLNALGGYFPGQSLGTAGASWQSFYNALPTLQSAQLAQNASIHNQELANQRAIAALNSASSGGSGGGGGSDGGLTAYQQYQVERDQRDFEYQLAKDADEADLEWAKFQADMDKEQGEAEGNAAMLAIAAELMGIDLPPKALAALAGGGSTSSIMSLFGNVADDRQGRADEVQDNLEDRRGRQQERREDMWGMLDFSGINDGLSKGQVTQKIIADIRAKYPNFNGVKESKVRARINSFVNDNWSNYRAGRPADAATGGGVDGFNKLWDRFEMGGTIRSAFDEYKSGLRPETPVSPGQRPSYRSAFASVMGAARSQWGSKWNMRIKKQVAKRVHAYLRSQPGLRRPPRRNPPRRPPRHNNPVNQRRGTRR